MDVVSNGTSGDDDTAGIAVRDRVGPGGSEVVGHRPGSSMSKHRVLLVNVVLAAILVSHVAYTVLRAENWPLSDYPMYSERRDDWSGRVMSIQPLPVEAGAAVDMTDDEWIAPYYMWQFIDAIEMAEESSDTRVEEMLQAMLDRYDERVSSGADLPPLAGLDLVEIEYRLEAGHWGPPPIVGREVIASYRR